MLKELEDGAREGQKGLWADPHLVPPWIYRKARRGQSLDFSGVVLLNIETPGNATTCGPSSSTSTAPYSVFGNHHSHTEAEAAGYRVTECAAKYDRRVSEVGQSLQASVSRGTGWIFSVSPCPDQSPSRRPTGPLTPQCASLAL